MSDFKVGSLVRCISADLNWLLVENEIYIVEEISHFRPLLKIRTKNIEMGWFNKTLFEVVDNSFTNTFSILYGEVNE